MSSGGHYVLDTTGRPVEVECKNTEELFKWAVAFEKNDHRVAWDEIGGVQVSTVFLGIDHNFFREGPPILFETMIFGDPNNEEFQRRYRTRAEAVGAIWRLSNEFSNHRNGIGVFGGASRRYPKRGGREDEANRDIPDVK